MDGVEKAILAGGCFWGMQGLIRKRPGLDEEQRRVADEAIADVEASGLWPGKVVTEVRPAGLFWEAEPEHQDYLERYPKRKLRRIDSTGGAGGS